MEQKVEAEKQPEAPANAEVQPAEKVEEKVESPNPTEPVAENPEEKKEPAAAQPEEKKEEKAEDQKNPEESKPEPGEDKKSAEEVKKEDEASPQESKADGGEAKIEEGKSEDIKKEDSKEEEKKEPEPDVVVEPKDERKDLLVQPILGLLWILRHIEKCLPKLQMEAMWRPEYEEIVNDFLTKKDKKKLFFWLDHTGLRVDSIEPPRYYEGKIEIEEDYQVAFFLKVKDGEITYKNIEESVIASNIEGDPLDDLKRKIEQILPKFRQEKWPEAMKKDFYGQLQTFMAGLFEAYQASRGEAELYIPDEDLSDISAAANDKDLVQQLGSNIVRWTRQIKNEVSNQDSQQERENSRPSEEIEHWKNRKKKLTRIKEQLDKNPQLQRIKKVLRAAESQELGRFEDEGKRIDERTAEAEDNVKYLEILTDSFKKLEASHPRDIPALLPEMLQRIRIIWELSGYYGQSDKMGNLLTKISNEIIRRCKSTINIDDLLDGDVEKCIHDLDESIDCGNQWKQEFEKMQRLINQYSKKKGFEFGKAGTKDRNDSIFAQIEAFKQRCNELKEIGQCQLQFAMKGKDTKVPEFPGSKGKDISSNLEELKRQFNKHLDSKIRELKKSTSILDLNNPKWHENITNFKSAMKDLDTMLLNIISNAEMSVCTVPEAAELVENFDYLANRQTVKEGIHDKIVLEHVYMNFKEEIKEIGRIFDHWTDVNSRTVESRYYYPLAHPSYSGNALFERSLISRLEYAYKGFDMLFFVRNTSSEREQCIKDYNQLKKRLVNHIKGDLYTSWKSRYVEPLGKGNEKEALELKFQQPVIIEQARNEQDSRRRFATRLECNFDKDLQLLYAEVKYWGKLQYSEISIISPILKIYKDRDDMRILKENVMLAVRDYNLIVQRLETEEKKLFAQHLTELYWKIMRNIDKYKWSNLQNHKFFQTVRDWRMYCEAVYNLVENYKKNVSIIESQLKSIEDTVMLEIDKSKPHLFSDFVAHQQRVIAKCATNFRNAFETIRKAITDIYDPEFLHAGEDIQKQFNTVVLNKYDTLLLEKLKRAVSRSLQELLTSLGTDEKEDTCQFIKIERDLLVEDQGISITFSPRIEELLEEFEKVFKGIKSSGAGIPRLAKKFREDREEMITKYEKRRKLEEEKAKSGKPVEERKPVLEVAPRADGKPRGFPSLDPKLPPTYEEILTQDNDVLGKIKKSVEPIKQHMDNLIKTFKTHSSQCEKPLTDEGKIRAYHTKPKRGGDIAGRFWERVYSDLDEKGIKRALEILDNNTTSNVKQQFVEFDAGKLRENLSKLKTEVKNVRLLIIYKSERQEMMDLLEKTFPKTIEKLMAQPSTPEELKEILLLREKVDTEEIGMLISSIQRAFAALKSQDYAIPPVDQQNEVRLPEEFIKFKNALSEADKEIEKNRKFLKSIMQSDLDRFATELETLSSDYDKQAPKSLDKNDVPNAKRIIADYKEKLKEKERAREEHKGGIELFKIEEMTYPKITYLKKELQLQTQFWELKEKWDEETAKMDVIQFRKLNIEAMTNRVLEFIDELENLPAEIKEWPAYSSLNKDVSLVRDILPLINEISTEAMNERHWDKLYSELKCEEFKPDVDFNFAKIKQLHLEKHAEFIRALSEEARRDLELEMSLKQIKDRWARLKLKIDHDVNTGYYRMKHHDDILDILEKDLNKLSEMKTSESFQAFQTDIESWESDLIKVSETLDLLWQVQGLWCRQEAIFNGQGSLSKQLGEKSDFDIVHQKFMKEMARIHKDQNVKKACLEKNFDKILFELNRKLENIDHVLTHFLDSKRGFFPRFYFLSNDELLEIVGCAHNVEPVRRHLKKIFEGIADLSYSETKSGITEISKVISAEKEEVILTKKVEVNRNSGVEDWLKDLKESVEATLVKELTDFPRVFAREKDSHKKLLANLHQHPGQIVIAAVQSDWTEGVENCIKSLGAGKDLFTKEYEFYDKQFIPAVADSLKLTKAHKDQRTKLQQLLTVLLHLRDVVYDLKSKQINSVTSFEWMKRLRFQRKSQKFNQASVSQGFEEIPYDYEYQGNNGRLVVTPLTERCYLVLTTAIYLRRGGAPHGPAGTGKTETVKDLAKACGKYIVVFNCSEGLSVTPLVRMFSGLVGCGAWGCFDEFNRIEVEVLSVAAHQIAAILDAIRAGQKSVDLVGTVALNTRCALFITYNPGYSSRSELPDNLKTLFRPIAMVVPDAEAIAENLFLTEGFILKASKQEKGERIYKELAKKVVSMYGILQRQLSKQKHYDFGLRAIISAIKYAGEYRQKLSEKEIDSEKLRDIVYKALDDLISPQLVAEDNEIFENLLGEMFSQQIPKQDNEELIIAIEKLFDEQKLTHNNFLKLKMLQLYSLTRIRHGNMIVGQTLSGKTTCWQILARALTLLRSKGGQEAYPQVKWHAINPKAVTVDELFGYNKNKEWQPGVIPTILKNACEEALPEGKESWLVLDGPVDPKWIESLNSLLDDNKCLTIGNGERISLNSRVRILFEVGNLNSASPATVSRCGMIYSEINDLGYVDSWIEQKSEQDRTFIKYLVDKYLKKVLAAKQQLCKEPIATSEDAAVINLCKLYDAIIPKKKSKEEMLDDYSKVMERCFIYALAWSIGGSVDEFARKEIDQVLRDIDATHCPSLSVSGTIYDFFVSIEKGGEWTLWEEKVPQNVKFDPATAYHNLVIDTVDSVRNRELVEVLIRGRNNILLIGNVGVGKTVLVNSLIKILGSEAYHSFSILFSGNTSAGKVQDVVESKFESHSRGRLFQPKNRQAICFADDINMPKKDEFGYQAPLELLRQWMDYGGWYDREKILFKEIVGLLLIGAMAPRSGGREEIPARALSKFHILNFTTPSEKQIMRIFSKVAEHKLQTFEDEEIKKMPDELATSTYNIYKSISQLFLPTPSKCHYTFNLRDVSKVFQGIQKANKTFYETKETVIYLWVHECVSVFNDRLVSQEDRKQFKEILTGELTKYGMTYDDVQAKYNGDLLFVDFLHEGAVYKDVKNFEELRNYLETKLKAYNTTSNLNIVLFKDAVYNLCKIYRALKMPRCHGLLLGVGGSGRHSLTRLAGAVANMDLEMPEMTRKFDFQTFRGNVKGVFRKAGIERKQVIFLLSDNELLEDAFFEDISNILTSGEVPGMYSSDEMRIIRDSIGESMKKDLQGAVVGAAIGQQQLAELQEVAYSKFIANVVNNLHVILCFSPIGSKFRNCCRDYPAVLNTTTCIWFLGWPDYALSEVANKFVQDVGLPEKQQTAIAKTIAYMHTSATEKAEKMKLEKKRNFYLTPTHYMDLMKGYQRIKEEKGKELEQMKAKMNNGLLKFRETEKRAEVMNTESSVKKQKNMEKVKKSEDMEQQLKAHYTIIAAQEANIKAKSLIRDKQREEAEALLRAAEEELARAEPKLEEAKKALSELKAAQITEVKGYQTPAPEVRIVLEAVMVILGKAPTWAVAKKEMANPHFIKDITDYNVNKLSDGQLKELEAYTKKSEFRFDRINKVSTAAGSFSKWVLAIEDVSKTLRSVEPKKLKREKAIETIQKLAQELAALEEERQKLANLISELSAQKKQIEDERDELRKEYEELEIKIERAEQLIKNLADFCVRWEKELENIKDQENKLSGDALISAAFLSYCGPLNKEYRDELMELWTAKIKENGIFMSSTYDFCNFMVGESIIREWRMRGLPTDKFSEQNAVIIMKSDRWPLVIDPQDQISHWLKQTEGKPGDRFWQLTRRSSKFFPVLETAVMEGKTMLISDVGEELDVELDNLLKKSFAKSGSNYRVKIQREVKYNPAFKLYMTTKLANPHYTPEISTKVTIINFALTEQALEDQLLDILFVCEEKELSKKKEANAWEIDTGKREVVEKERQILWLLNESTASLLDNDELVTKMLETKENYEKNSEAIANLESNMKKIEDTRGKYRSCAREGAILFFVLNDLSHIDPMYQFSLKSYKSLFKSSVESSSGTLVFASFEQKLEKMKDTLRSNVYKKTCDTLFEKHKLLLAFQICYRLKMTDVDQELWSFFLRGGIVLNRKEQPQNINADWLPPSSWDNVTELEKIPTFAGIVSSLQLNSLEWSKWYMNPQPESQNLPSEWDSKCDDYMKKLVIIRSLRPDRVTFVVKDLIKKLWPGYKDASTKPISLAEVMSRTKINKPLLCILGPGVDPTESIAALAEEKIKGKPLLKVSLGQEQAEVVAKALDEGVRKDTWVYFANCHYAIDTIQGLTEQIVHRISKKDRSERKEEPKNFRIILSSTSHPKFPISLLRSCEKLTIESLTGIKANMCRIYQSLPASEEFVSQAERDNYSRAIFSLAFYHCVLLERRRFRNLGWNKIYNFNLSDIFACENLIRKSLKNSLTDLTTIQELITNALYGGRVTDENDRDVLKVYTKESFSEAIFTKDWRPVRLKDDIIKYEYPQEQQVMKTEDEKRKFIPKDFLEHISTTFPSEDPPEVFGQHLNAEISTQIADTNLLLESILLMQPRFIEIGTESSEDEVLKLAENVLEKDSIPEYIDMEGVRFKLRSENNPLNYVLNQEVQRYNGLIYTVKSSLIDLIKCLKGEIVMTSQMEEIYNSLHENRVPRSWLYAYPSIKAFGVWLRDFKDRVMFFTQWVKQGLPSPFLLSAFTSPLSFTTALLQKYARKKKISNLNDVEMQHEFLSARTAVGHPEDGAYVKGLYIEGAYFDETRQLLLDPQPMKFAHLMPVVHFKPKVKKAGSKDKERNVYNCPCYYYPVRGDTNSYLFSIALECGERNASMWLKRGTALLLSLEQQHYKQSSTQMVYIYCAYLSLLKQKAKMYKKLHLFFLFATFFIVTYASSARDYADGMHYPPDMFNYDQINNGAAVFYFLGLLYMFFGIMQVHRLYLEPCLHLFRKTKTFDDDTMDSTVVPIATTAPESFISFFATFFGVTDVGISAFLGTNAFTACVERGVLILIAGAFGEIDWYTSLRDMITYAITLFAISMLLTNGSIDTSNTILMLLIFFVYWAFMQFNKTIEKYARQAVYLKNKFRVGPRLTDSQISEIHSLKRRVFESLPESYIETPYKLENGWVECTYQGNTGIFQYTTINRQRKSEISRRHQNQPEQVLHSDEQDIVRDSRKPHQGKVGKERSSGCQKERGRKPFRTRNRGRVQKC
eukprot:TRINITY_DN1846_c1_g1_i1.p2 TRINITY_DN1846_c1_g1~~TRINITY_DN1846_c1_g1_i1.p2  ORF type:complete len:5107 (+),score=843.18 TRINITY_DN1846_c1_g1_i1:25620-40940(+)